MLLTFSPPYYCPPLNPSFMSKSVSLTIVVFVGLGVLSLPQQRKRESSRIPACLTALENNPIYTWEGFPNENNIIIY